MSSPEVDALLGRPSSRSNRHEESAGGSTARAYWKGHDTLVGFCAPSSAVQLRVCAMVVGSASPLKTSKGIGIGSSRQAVRTTYAALPGAKERRDDIVVDGVAPLVFGLGERGVDVIYWGRDFGP